MRVVRVIAAGIIGILAVAAFASPASAVTTINRGNFTATARQTLTFDPGGIMPVCDISLAFTMSTRIAVTLPMGSAVRVGSAVGGSSGNCTGGGTLTLLRVPWNVDMITSGGPGNVTGNTRFTIRNVQFLIGIGALSCLYAGDLSGSLNAGGTTRSYNSNLPYVSGLICPRPLTVQGTTSVSPAMVVTLT